MPRNIPRMTPVPRNAKNYGISITDADTNITVKDKMGDAFANIRIITDRDGYPEKVIINGVVFSPGDITMNGMPPMHGNPLQYGTTPEEIKEII
jgi:hypothetical protein